MSSKILLSFVIFLIIIAGCTTKTIKKEVQEEPRATQEEREAPQEEEKTAAESREFGLDWTLTFDGTILKLDSIAVNDNPAIILPKRILSDSISGRINKVDDLFNKGFKDKMNVINNKKKLEVPVDRNGKFSFKAGDILKYGKNDVHFDLAVNKGFWLTGSINVLFVVSEEKRD